VLLDEDARSALNRALKRVGYSTEGPLVTTSNPVKWRDETMEEDIRGQMGNGATDNLKAIKGIDANALKALHKAGIHRFTDLSPFSPEDLSNILRTKADADYSPDFIRSKNWIKQAKILVNKRPEGVTGEKGAGEKKAENHRTKTPQKNWHNHAEFSVFFDSLTNSGDELKWQTRVYHAQSGKEKVFPGYDPSDWTAWMASKADLRFEAKAPPPGKEKAQPVQLNKPGEAQLSITKFEISQIQRGLKNRLIVDAAFTVRGPRAGELIEARVPYRMEVELVDLDRKKSQTVASHRGSLETEESEYAQRYELDMPEAGSYEMHYMAVLLPPAEMMAYRRIPNIKVVPS
jgi:predicted flap endonuclease-1-like 5' DNA nuclease